MLKSMINNKQYINALEKRNKILDTISTYDVEKIQKEEIKKLFEENFTISEIIEYMTIKVMIDYLKKRIEIKKGE